ncbi:DUF1700 domain-containing protein [Anaerotignum faecicola]|nr:DUF1700 domain-containing protein [Anaerotignum faecicola]
MTKAEFLHTLEKRLQVLNEKERADILNEYSQHIDMRVESGLTEEETIKDFGNFDELVSEILEAYNLNPDFNRPHIDSEEITKKVSSAFSKFTDILSETFQSLKILIKNIPYKKPFSLIKFIIMVFAILLIYLLCVLIVGRVSNFAYYILPGFIAEFTANGIIIVFHLVYIILAITVLYTYVTNSNEKKDETAENGNGTYSDSQGKPSKTRRVILPKINFSKKERRKHMELNIGRPILNFIILITKLIILFFLLPLVLFIFCSIIGIGILIVLCFMGYPVIGITIGAIGLSACGVTFIWFIWDLLFKNKEA